MSRRKSIISMSLGLWADELVIRKTEFALLNALITDKFYFKDGEPPPPHQSLSHHYVLGCVSAFNCLYTVSTRRLLSRSFLFSTENMFLFSDSLSLSRSRSASSGLTRTYFDLELPWSARYVAQSHSTKRFKSWRRSEKQASRTPS